MTIQRVELTKFYDMPVHCPFCGSRVVDYGDESSEPHITPCAHTLFVAHDEGLEFRSKRFDDNLSLTGIDTDDIEPPEGGFDALTDRVTLPDSVKFAAYVGPPSGFGSYVGFAPLAE